MKSFSHTTFLLGCALCLSVLSSCVQIPPAASPSYPEPVISQPAAPPTPSVPDVPVPAPEPEPKPDPTPAVPADDPLPLPDGLPLTLLFASGAGGWGSELTLMPDGSFSGEYHDSEMGITGEGYPHGTLYYCQFGGQFKDIHQVDTHTWALTLDTLVTARHPGEETIEDLIRHVSAEPYGIEAGTEFLLYLPDTPAAGLNEEFLSWWHYRYEQPETLSCYGLYNVEMGYGFFS